MTTGTGITPQTMDKVMATVLFAGLIISIIISIVAYSNRSKLDEKGNKIKYKY